jgi:hypothetical protein
MTLGEHHLSPPEPLQSPKNRSSRPKQFFPLSFSPQSGAICYSASVCFFLVSIDIQALMDGNQFAFLMTFIVKRTEMSSHQQKILFFQHRLSCFKSKLCRFARLFHLTP